MAALHPSPPFDELTYYPTARWIRGMRRGDTIVDSRRAVLVWEPGRPTPIYAFPREDVSIVSDDPSIEGLREFADQDLDGFVTIAWDAMDRWLEEDEEIFIHPRDPFVRVDALKSSRHVRVERKGHLLAESDAPVLVFETGRPTRYYLKPSDLDESLLEDSELQTGCPYKGYASYRDVVVAGRRHPNLFWYYRRPFAEVSAIKDLVAPYSERVDVIVDGELQERPAGPLGRRGAAAKRAA
jgi:uncharacterized protein (DUF427 family)